MTKIDKIREKYAKAQAGKEALQAEIAALDKKCADLEAEAKEIAITGDTAGYMKKKAEADKANAELYVKKAQLDVANTPITEAEVKEAWQEYIKGADKDLQAAWIDYKKKRTALFTQMQKCMDMMRDSFLKREELYTYVVGDPYQAKMQARSNLTMFTIESTDMINDRLMFVRNGVLTPDKDMLYGALTGGHFSSL